MGQYVIEFTADNVESMVELLDELVVPKTSILTLHHAEVETLNFRQIECKLSSTLPDLISQKISAVLINSADSIRYGLITCPKFNGQELSQWMGTIEVTTDIWRPLWNNLLKHNFLNVVCVGLEEGINLTDTIMNATTFPWQDLRLLVGAIRQADGSWDKRENQFT
jgi:hypothetical protein